PSGLGIAALGRLLAAIERKAGRSLEWPQMVDGLSSGLAWRRRRRAHRSCRSRQVVESRPAVWTPPRPPSKNARLQLSGKWNDEQESLFGCIAARRRRT